MLASSLDYHFEAPKFFLKMSARNFYIVIRDTVYWTQEDVFPNTGITAWTELWHVIIYGLSAIGLE